MDQLYFGQTIKVLRSNGALQSGEIVEINVNKQRVKDGSKRSKYLYLDEILRTNPDLKNRRSRANVNNLPLENISNDVNQTSTRRLTMGINEGLMIKNNKNRLDENPRKLGPSFITVENNIHREDVHRLSPYYEYNKLIINEEASMDFYPLEYKLDGSHKKMEVFVRVRPLNKKEKAGQEIMSLAIPNAQSLVLFMPQVKVDQKKYITLNKFEFDAVFNENVDNECIYKITCRHLIDNFFDSGCSTCFAYGQTGSGKTFTMHGKNAQAKSKGLYTLTAVDVFERFNNKNMERSGYSIYCAFFEIYMNKAYDLLNTRKELRVQADEHDKVQISGLKKIKCDSPVNVLDILKKGTLLRSCGKTKANKESSRSHAIFQFILVQNEETVSKLSLVDLAGNERGADSGDVDRVTRNEGNAINVSLLALKECIRQMSNGSADRIPFRNSALTQFLKDSFIGEKSKLCMITTISPSINNCEVTLNSLKYAEQVVKINQKESSIPPVIEEENIEDMDIEDQNKENLLVEEELFRVEKLWKIVNEGLYDLENYMAHLKGSQNTPDINDITIFKKKFVDKINNV
uniref:Kinesin-like protein n=1 Tax=Parastrongyloides trichosuri TaxID=131310 RepID=A0A0N5A251_PARTI